MGQVNPYYHAILACNAINGRVVYPGEFENWNEAKSILEISDEDLVSGKLQNN